MQNHLYSSTISQVTSMKSDEATRTNRSTLKPKVQQFENPREKWDYVGVCEFTGSYDADGWPQDDEWGHENKYGNKRFGKGRLGHM